MALNPHSRPFWKDLQCAVPFSMACAAATCVELNQACRLQTPSAWMVLHRGSLNAQKNQGDVPDKVPDSSPPMAPAMASHSPFQSSRLDTCCLQTANCQNNCRLRCDRSTATNNFTLLRTARTKAKPCPKSWSTVAQLNSLAWVFV